MLLLFKELNNDWFIFSGLINKSIFDSLIYCGNRILSLRLNVSLNEINLPLPRLLFIYDIKDLLNILNYNDY